MTVRPFRALPLQQNEDPRDRISRSHWKTPPRCRHVLPASAHRLFTFELQERNLNLPRNDQQSVQDSSPLAETSESYTHSSHNGPSVGPGMQHDPPEVIFMA